MIYGILAPNPEAYREWQYNEYQRGLTDDDNCNDLPLDDEEDNDE